MGLFLKKILFYSLLLLGLNMALGYFLASYESVDLGEKGLFFPKLRWDDYYQRKDSIDILVLGSSHAYRSYDPQVMERELGPENQVFNFGSSAQSPVTGYYILEEVLNRYQPKLLIVDIYFMVFISDELRKNGLINWRYMRSGAAKKKFFLHGFSREEQITTIFFPSGLYKNYLKPKVKKLLGLRYLPPPKGQYIGDGYVRFSDTLTLEKLKNQNQFDRFEIDLSSMTDKNLIYLRQMVEMARSKGTAVLFTVSPMPEISVQKIKNYQEISAFFRNCAHTLSVPYYDFNVERLPEIKDEVHFYDDDHLNIAGAGYFSKAIAGIIQKEMNGEK